MAIMHGDSLYKCTGRKSPFGDKIGSAIVGRLAEQVTELTSSSDASSGQQELTASHLVQLRHITSEAADCALSHQYNVPYMYLLKTDDDVNWDQIDLLTLEIFPRYICQQFKFVPFRLTRATSEQLHAGRGDLLDIAMVNPHEAVNVVEIITCFEEGVADSYNVPFEVHCYVANQRAVTRCLERAVSV